jgi:signal transduction histidine kinase
MTTVAPTAWQRRLTLVIVAMVLIATAAIAPFGAVQLRPMGGFIPTTEVVIVICDLLIAALLASHAMIVGSRRLLLLAGGFLFDGSIVIPHALTFPGAFAPAGLLGAGLQTTAWLFIIWHFALPAAVIGYVFMPRKPHPLTAATIYWEAAFVVALAVLLTWIVAAYGDILPALFVDQRGFTPLANIITGFDLAVSAVALLALLSRRKKSVFDLWLTVAVVALVAELAVTTFVIASRFSLGFYASRLLSVAASTIVLIALLVETVRHEVRLARANLALQLERSRKLVTLDVALGALTHEVKQPLSSIVNNAEAAQMILDQPAPDIAQMREIVGDIMSESYRANDIIKNIHGLFRTSREDLRRVDMNKIVTGIMRGMQGDLGDNGVKPAVALETELPAVLGHEGQLQEVVFNLVRNAIDAMRSGSAAERTLQVRTEKRGHDAIGIFVQDSGPGIVPAQIERIFDPFVTTKKNGMGMGLTVCRMIIERHGGKLSASSSAGAGARFDITLPVEPAAEADQQSDETAIAAVLPARLIPTTSAAANGR